MEDDKKKKKNKKKKNKNNSNVNNNNNNTKPLEAEIDPEVPIPIAANGETASSVDHNHLNDAPVSEISDVDSAAAAPKSEVDKEQEHDKHYNANGALFQLSNLEGRILQLEQEKESQDQEMASLEMKTAWLQSEKDSWLQKEVGLLEKIGQLQNENCTLGSKVTILEERIKQLDGEREAWLLKEANIEETVKNLHREREGWLQKEVNIGETVKNLYREREDWLKKEVSLEDKIKHMSAEISTWAAKENLANKTITSLNNDYTNLRRQVTELEELRENLSQENQKLLACLSEMQSQIQMLEKTTHGVYSSNESQKGAENEELYSQLEAASALVEKLITENADLVEKVHELYVELEQKTVKAQSSSSAGSDVMIENVESSSTVDPVSETREKSVRHVALKTAPSKEETIGNNISIDSPTMMAPLLVEKKENSPGHLEIAEIIQMPLDENEIQELDSQTTDNEETEVSFTDAPLIGAPFRLISFVAKYVSGADLVNKNASDLGH